MSGLNQFRTEGPGSRGDFKTNEDRLDLASTGTCRRLVGRHIGRVALSHPTCPGIPARHTRDCRKNLRPFGVELAFGQWQFSIKTQNGFFVHVLEPRCGASAHGALALGFCLVVVFAVGATRLDLAVRHRLSRRAFTRVSACGRGQVRIALAALHQAHAKPWLGIFGRRLIRVEEPASIVAMCAISVAPATALDPVLPIGAD